MGFILQLLNGMLLQCSLKVIAIILVVMVKPEVSIRVGILEV